MMAGLDKRDEKFTSNLAKEYQRIQNELEKDIAYWYQSYGRAETMEYRSVMKKLSPEEQASAFRDFDSFVNENPQYARLLPIRNSIYQLNRLEAMQLSVRLKMAELGVIEQEQMRKYLQSSYKFGYESTMRNLENKESFFGFNEKQLELTLSDKWFNDKNYSDRIWDNKDTLRNWMTSDLATGLQQGISYDKMIKQLQQRIDVGKFYAKRLVWTESAFFLNTANAHAFMADGIKRYQYVAIIDERTSKTCQTLNGQIFDFADYKPGINAPPMHSFCRSTIIPLEAALSRKQTTLTVEQAQKITPKNNQNRYTVNRNVINTKKYHDKFEAIKLNKNLLEKVYSKAIEALEIRDGTEYEDIFVFDSRTGLLLAQNIEPTEPFVSRVSRNDFENEKYDILTLLHNHPESGRLSFADIKTMYKNEDVDKSIAVGHDGSVHMVYGMNRKKDLVRYHEKWYNYYKSLGYPSNESLLRATDRLYESGAFKYVKK